jgi:hypothetical protein
MTTKISKKQFKKPKSTQNQNYSCGHIYLLTPQARRRKKNI